MRTVSKLTDMHCGRLAVFVAIALMIPAFRAEACSCAFERSPGDAMRVAAAVLEATVVDQRAVLISVPYVVPVKQVSEIYTAL